LYPHRNDPFEPDPVDTDVGKGRGRIFVSDPTFRRQRPDLKQPLIEIQMKHIALPLALTVLTTGLHAQSVTEAPESTQEEAIQLETTVVTGSLWESDLQNTTASITVLDEAQLQVNGVQHFQDVINAIPNLTWTGGSSRPRYIQIRGIGENSQFEGETPDSSVAFLMDDLDITGLGTIGNLFDVQQVEVLRGPQAGAFGVNAAGGVIQVVTNDPTPYWTGQAQVTVGSDSLFAEGVAVGGPIIESDPEKLTFRLSVHQLNQDGFRNNVVRDKDDTNKRDEFTSRLKVRWLANEDWQWDATLLYADADNGYDEWTMNNSRSHTYTDEPGHDRQETFAGSVRGTWMGFDSFNVTTITSYAHSDSDYAYDADWVSGDYDSIPAGTYDGYMKTDRDRDVFSQEIRLDSIDQEDALGWIDRWTLGTYFSKLKEDSKVSYDDYGGGVRAKSRYETESYSLFGQLAHDFTEATRLIVGLRYEYHKVSNDTLSVDDYGDWYDGTLNGKDSDDNNSLYGGKITLEHDLNAQHMIFSSFAVGYKAGGANGGVFREEGDPLTYGNETLYNTEVGLRSEWFDAAVLSEVTAFYLYRDNPQLRDSGGSGGFFHYYTDNGDHAEHYGLEADGTWFITRKWTFNAGLGLLQTQNDDNEDLANAPHYTYNASLSYQADNGFFADIEVVGSDKYYESNSEENRSEKVRNAFTVVNGSIGYRYQTWTLTLWVKNLFDEKYEDRVFYFDNGDGDSRYEDPADPQQFGVTVNYTW
jgi:outer membrane receptor protein involved in Fe transport